MRKLKFNRMERMAGAFILLAIVGTMLVSLSIVVKKGVFDPKVRFYTHLANSDNIRMGTPVRMVGLKVGAVESIELDTNGKIKVVFTVLRRFANRVHEDSQVVLMRPSIIGEKVFDVSAGTAESPIRQPNSLIPSSNTEDVIDALSGKKLSMIIENIDQISKDVAALMGQVNRKDNLAAIVGNLREASDNIRLLVPKLSGSAPKLSKDVSQIMSNFVSLTNELVKIAPKLTETAANIPAGTEKILELMNESVVLVRAMQRSFLLRGAVSDIKEEEAEKKKSSENRMPAQASPQPSPRASQQPPLEK